MADAWRVTDWKATPTADGTRVSARLDGTEVWFEGAALADAPPCGDPFLAVALLAAMAAGRPLDLGDLPPVSPRLLATLPTIQSLWTQWNPYLSRIEVRANVGEPGTPRATTGTFFSGGIDAVHAALDGGAPGQMLVIIDGFDFPADAAALEVRQPSLRRLAARLQGELVVVRTNWIAWRRGLRLSGALMHGGCLAAVAQLVAPGRMTIASSNAYSRLTPWGSNALIDPLWSTERTTIRHWGAQCTRGEKIVRLAGETDLHRDLWVCHNQPVGNCGRCPKCARTRLAFWLAGAELPVDADAARVHPVSAYLPHLADSSEPVYIPELLELARDRHDGTRERLARGARALARRQLMRDLRNALFPAAAARRMAAADLRPWGRGPAPRLL